VVKQHSKALTVLAVHILSFTSTHSRIFVLLQFSINSLLKQQTSLLEELDAHLLLHVCALQGVAELLEGDHLVVILVRLLDGALGDAVQLVLADVLAHHHLEHCQQFAAGDGVVVVQVVHLEGKAQLLLPPVELVVLRPLDGPEVREDGHELVEVDAVVPTVFEEGMHDPVSQGVDGELWDAEEVLARQGAQAALVQAGEAAVQALDLAAGESSIRLNYFDILIR